MAKRVSKRSSATLYPGTPVTDDSGRTGTLSAVDGEESLHIAWDDGETETVPRQSCTIHGGKIRVHDASTGAMAAHSGTDVVVETRDSFSVPIIAEEIRAETVWRDAGSVWFHVRTEEIPRSLSQLASHEELVIEEVPIGLPLAPGDTPEPRQEGETLIIPIVEEIPVVTMQRVVAKEVRVTKRTVQAEQAIQVTERRQRVEVDPGTLAGRVNTAGSAPASTPAGREADTPA